MKNKTVKKVRTVCSANNPLAEPRRLQGITLVHRLYLFSIALQDTTWKHFSNSSLKVNFTFMSNN